jgi:hypothetical protein
MVPPPIALMNELVPPRNEGASCTDADRRKPRVGSNGSLRLSYRYPGVNDEVVPVVSVNFCGGGGWPGGVGALRTGKFAVMSS